MKCLVWTRDCAVEEEKRTFVVVVEELCVMNLSSFPKAFCGAVISPIVCLVDVNEVNGGGSCDGLVCVVTLVSETDAVDDWVGRVSSHVRESSLEAVEKRFGVILGRCCAVGYMGVVKVLDHGLAHARCPLEDLGSDVNKEGVGRPAAKNHDFEDRFVGKEKGHGCSGSDGVGANIFGLVSEDVLSSTNIAGGSEHDDHFLGCDGDGLLGVGVVPSVDWGIVCGVGNC